MTRLRLLVIALLVVGGVARVARADDATAAARSHYEIGLQLFDAREHEQALIEFSRANDLKSRPAALFMMAQCQYLLGRLKEARVNYERYVEENPQGEFAALARDRVSAIDRRPSTFVINAVPDDVTVRIAPEADARRVVATGQAPNNFSVPRGRYRVDVTKPKYQGQTRIVDIDLAETKPLFFKLEPIPARLAIETYPPGATLYVNGNRARNPYRQELAPGAVEIFAEAPNYIARTVDLTLAAGADEQLTGARRLTLPYRQRSGRPELLGAATVVGGLFGAGAVVAAIGGSFQDRNVSSVLLASGGAIAGGIVGLLVATPLVPEYIPDNKAFFIMGAMWIGLVDGALMGIVGQQIDTASDSVKPQPAACPGPTNCRGSLGDELRAGFYGSAGGLALGLTGGVLLRNRAPTYGRVAMIQSAALGGAFVGALAQVALDWKPYGQGWPYTVNNYNNGPDPLKRNPSPQGAHCGEMAADGSVQCSLYQRSVMDLMPGALIGLNVGLAAGLLGAYLPDQKEYGPTWQRVLLVDAAVVAGGVAGATIGCVANPSCLNQDPDDRDRAIAAGAALLGGALGFVGGVLATHHVGEEPSPRDPAPSMPMATFAPMRATDGSMIPAVAAFGSF
ncbi:MAG TPA: tetratricopeptide repeat protein [Polyangia bacterium]|nr:tetratricopeptide repeat protein [Polyangia bacterium]